MAPGHSLDEQHASTLALKALHHKPAFTAWSFCDPQARSCAFAELFDHTRYCSCYSYFPVLNRMILLIFYHFQLTKMATSYGSTCYLVTSNSVSSLAPLPLDYKPFWVMAGTLHPWQH